MTGRDDEKEALMGIVKVGTYRNVPMVSINGTFDVLNAPEVRALWPSLLTEGSPNLLIDMREVSFIDSTALATLVSGLRTARQTGGYFRLFGLQEAVQSVFDITRLSQAFQIYATADAALAAE